MKSSILFLIIFFSCQSFYSHSDTEDSLLVKWTFYHSNGKVKRIESYLNGIKQGIWTTYDLDGILVSKYIYSRGELKSEEIF